MTFSFVTAVRTFESGDKTGWRLGRLALSAQGSVPMVIAGIVLVSGADGGLYWVLAECISALGVGVASAWILLIEIRR